jgi:hypothetical protein
MAEPRSIARPIVLILCVGVTTAGLLNVYADNSDVIAKAQTAACGSPTCAIQMTRMSRNPISQSFTFQTNIKERRNINEQTTADVDCQRAYFLVGEYACVRKGGAAPAGSVSP